MVKRLNQYAQHTPFNTSDTDKMGKYLYNAGIEGDKMFDTMTSLGDVTSAYGGSAADAVEVTRQYAQVMQSGTAYTEDLNIMNDRGIPIYQAIAEQMGINVGEVKKMASQGKISSEIYGKAVATLGDKVKGSMDKQSKTWTGMLSTFEDVFGQLMGTLTSPIFEVAKQALGGLLEYLGSESFMTSVQG
ncbi:tape measure protein, partial [Herbiconiux daphne]